jgi:hypothetical protein
VFAVGGLFSFRLMVAQVLGLCLNRGPLCEPLNLVQFFAVFTLPITPQAIFNGAPMLPWPMASSSLQKRAAICEAYLLGTALSQQSVL